MVLWPKVSFADESNQMDYTCNSPGWFAMSPVFWAICADTSSASYISGLAIGPLRLDFPQMFMKLNVSYGPLLYVAGSSTIFPPVVVVASCPLEFSFVVVIWALLDVQLLFDLYFCVSSFPNSSIFFLIWSREIRNCCMIMLKISQHDG